MLNVHLRPKIARFSDRVPIKISPDKIDKLINDVGFFIKGGFTPSVAVGIANDLGLFLLRLVLEHSDKTLPLDLESYLDVIYQTILNIASRHCKF